MALVDAWRRPLRSLRVSVTDRCNLRCAYCMPEEEYAWLPRKDLLRFEEIGALADVFADHGVDRVRITGGEPLLRRDLPSLLRILAGKPALRDIALTTNGVLLAEQAQGLVAAGLHRITVSLDTLRAERFRALNRFDHLPRVREGIAEASRVACAGLKIDTVVLRGVNDDELVPLLEYGKGVGAEVRFIEYMDVGGATRWSMDDVVPRREMLERIGRHYGGAEPVLEDGAAPAERFRLPDGTVFGIIASVTAPFCRACDRSRLTADGHWYLCLYAPDGIDLRAPLRAGASREELGALVAGAWSRRTDRGAEQRLALRERTASASVRDLRQDPRLEMHTRGG